MKLRYLLVLIFILLGNFCFCKTTALPDFPSERSNGTNILKEDAENEKVFEKWRVFEKQVKKISSSIYKSALPLMIHGYSEANISSSCSRGLMKTLTGIKQMKLWAYRMIDSAGKIPSGFLGTNLNALGEYDMCLSLDVPGHFQGQYCTIVIDFPLPKRRPFTASDMELPEFINFTDPSTVTALFLRNAQAFYFLKFRTSLCLPSTCSVEDVQKLSDIAMKSSGIDFDVKVVNCEYKKDAILDTSDIVIICVVCTIIMLGIIGTIVDVYITLVAEEKLAKNKSLLIKCLLCFSFYTNTKRLLKKDDSPDTIKIFHGMKVITLLWVMLNHSYYYVNFQFVGSIATVHEWRQRISFQLLANGFLNVETFFFISAVLISYAVTKLKNHKLGMPFVFMYIFRRFWRLTPPFMLVIATSFLVPYLGSGPAWQETVVKGLIDKCKRNWWTNLLYINNFIPVNDACFQWMWYLPADTHMYILSLVVLIPLNRNVKYGFIANGVLFIAGIIATAVNHVYYQLHPTAITAFSHPDDSMYYTENGYFRSYVHISTYCVGMCVGYFIAERKTMRIPKVVNILGWLISSVAALTVLYGVYEWNQGNVPNLAVSTLYTCTNKLVWSLALGWVTVSCMTGNGGIATSILGWQGFVPFSRLTYMAYLVHPIFQFVYIGSTRVLIRAEHRTLVYAYFGHVVMGYMCAYFLSLLFESPFMCLEKVFLSPNKNTQRDASAVPKESEKEKRWKPVNLNKKSGKYDIKNNDKESSA